MAGGAVDEAAGRLRARGAVARARGARALVQLVEHDAHVAMQHAAAVHIGARRAVRRARCNEHAHDDGYGHADDGARRRRRLRARP